MISNLETASNFWSNDVPGGPFFSAKSLWLRHDHVWLISENFFLVRLRGIRNSLWKRTKKKICHVILIMAKLFFSAFSNHSDLRTLEIFSHYFFLIYKNFVVRNTSKVWVIHRECQMSQNREVRKRTKKKFWHNQHHVTNLFF